MPGLLQDSREDRGLAQLHGISGAVVQGVGKEDPGARIPGNDARLQAHDEFLRVDVECDLAGASEHFRE